MVENDWGVNEILQMILTELKQSTRSSEKQCLPVAQRLVEEARRICEESKRIQSSGDIQKWMINLAKNRLQQCLKYYKLGSRNGRVELHSTLSAIVYRYITPPQIQSSYQARLSLIEDFLQAFYVESLNAFRREAKLGETFSPQSLLELAEYMAFTERYGKRRITLSGGRIQQLIILRAQTFSQQQPPETLVDIEQAAEGTSLDLNYMENDTSIREVRQAMVSPEAETAEESLREKVIQELIAYLEERQQNDCADYFALRLQDLPTQEIEAILGLTPRERDYLQQRFKYHLMRFALSHQWELVHEWLEADLDRNLGLTPTQWQDFIENLESEQKELLRLKQQGLPDTEIAQKLGCTVNQVNKRWFKLLNLAWEIRNGSSGKS
ncbi:MULTISPECIES: heterocyst differentiation protein HetZ [Planktothricoides]|uniref:Heterocyst differentiation protein HetZ n=2 Tax=Planktothricoides raciborskii TaxID=132608 RepID=A0AAU8JLM1_9CYAN|nr:MULTISPECIES: heterocyst differentiation protein HetZ [Planktothricoides]KOR34816.1 ATPase involved in DNA repair [Planktothricoides sp. SR001]MBD2545359.1 heterocyst differentiation protein HetZ [Planktothricoides raciborskii FACHB-1370]MBD2583216.1 heterocyst differentiation protein HetZ [Planktothricoides raciborskii FACHB-1261]